MDESNILNYDIYEVTNPLDKSFTTLWAKRSYTIKPRGHLLLPKFLAEKLAYELAEQVVQKGKGGIAAILNKTLMAQETAKLLRLTQAANPQSQEENALERQINQLNDGDVANYETQNVDPSSLGSVIEPDDESERNSTKDNLNPNANPADAEDDKDVVDTTEDADPDFADVQDEDGDVKEAMRENLMVQKRADLVEQAQDLGIELDYEDTKKVTKGVIADAIVKHNTEVKE